MHSYQTTINKFLWIGLAVPILMGCGAKPSEFKQTADEMKEGPGVFTGEDGEFKIYSSERGGPFWKHSQEKSEEATKEESKAAGKEASAASEKPSQTT